MKRLFVALPVPEVASARIAVLRGGVPGARWVEPGNFHLTLRFIGEVDGRVERDVVGSLSSLRFRRFDIALAGLGHFESRGRVRALWLGVDSPPELKALWRKVEQAMISAGLEATGRKFKPHVTLARLKDAPAERVSQFMAMHALFRTEPFTVKSVMLLESMLGYGPPNCRTELEVPLLEVPVSDLGAR